MSRSWKWWAEAYCRMNIIHLSRGIQVTPFEAMERKWYILGDLPPNYPVPAIPIDINFNDKFSVSCWQGDNEHTTLQWVAYPTHVWRPAR